jgi:hypothetical protein
MLFKIYDNDWNEIDTSEVYSYVYMWWDLFFIKRNINTLNVNYIRVIKPNKNYSGIEILQIGKIVPGRKKFSVLNLIKYSIINFFRDDKKSRKNKISK